MDNPLESFMYGFNLNDVEEEKGDRETMRYSIISSLLPYFRGDQTEGMIDIARKIEDYIYE